MSQESREAQQRTVVVLGGTGRVAEGVVAEWARSGAKVIVPTRSERGAAELQHRTAGIPGAENIRAVVGDYTGFESAVAMADRIDAEFGGVTDVIASIGGWWQGAATWDIDEQTWQRHFVDLTTAHFASVRAWLPRLSAEGAYQLILGGSAYTPVPGASIISMEQAALLMMHRVLTAEAGEQRRVFAITLGPVATRGRSWVDPSWVSASDVGRVTVAHALGAAPSGHVDVRTHEQADARVAEAAGPAAGAAAVGADAAGEAR